MAEPMLSAVVPAFNEGCGIQAFLKALSETLHAITPRYEIILVDDGSTDDTGLKVKQLQPSEHIKYLRFSRNFGKEKAISAGLDHTAGDAVVIIDADFQHPLALIETFWQYWEQGYDTVYGVRGRTDQGLLKRWCAKGFYRINQRIMSVPLPPHAGDFRLMDRRVVEAIRLLPESNRFMKGLYAWVGFRGIGIPYQVQQRAEGKSRFNFLKLFSLAITGMTAFSDWPLRIWSLVGACVSLGALVYGVCILISTLIYGNNVPGWATLAVGLLFLGGIQLISIGVIAEYIARIFTEVKRRPQYIVAEKHGFSD